MLSRARHIAAHSFQFSEIGDQNGLVYASKKMCAGIGMGDRIAGGPRQCHRVEGDIKMSERFRTVSGGVALGQGIIHNAVLGPYGGYLDRRKEWLSIDVGPSSTFELHHCVVDYSNNWVLQASNDGIEWVKPVGRFIITSSVGIKIWRSQTNKTRTRYRYFRVMANMWRLRCRNVQYHRRLMDLNPDALELYGVLIPN